MWIPVCAVQTERGRCKLFSYQRLLPASRSSRDPKLPVSRRGVVGNLLEHRGVGSGPGPLWKIPADRLEPEIS